MTHRLIPAAVILLVLGACSQVDNDAPGMGQYLGEIEHMRVYAFTTQDGTPCVLATGAQRGALSCAFGAKQ